MTMVGSRDEFERSIEPMLPREIFFGFRGRLPRRDFWLYGVGAMLGLGTMGWMLLSIAGVASERADRITWALLAWPTMAISAKRWHDQDRSGWWALFYFVPVLGTFVLLVANGFARGSEGPNRYGEPLAALR